MRDPGNEVGLIDQYFNMTPRLSGQTSIFGGVLMHPSLFWEL